MFKNKSILFALIISLTSLFCLLVSLPFILVETGVYVYAIFFSVFLFLLSFFVIRYYLRLKFDKLYYSINKSYNNHNNNDFKKAEKAVEVWVKDKEIEIQQLKSHEKFRKEFIGNLAHELKTPLFSTQGYVLTLLEGGLEDESINLKFLKKASKNIDRMSEIINDMDTITKIESSNIDLNIVSVEIVDLINSVFEELEDLAADKNIELKLVKKPVNEIYVLADKVKITQVFNNLILNSIFYGIKNGKTEVFLNDKKGKLELKIQDNGIGIESKYLPRIFERFFRVEKSRDRNKGGSGIGLAIVKHVIEAHNQSIEVKSEIGKGTSFIFELNKG